MTNLSDYPIGELEQSIQIALDAALLWLEDMVNHDCDYYQGDKCLLLDYQALEDECKWAVWYREELERRQR